MSLDKEQYLRAIRRNTSYRTYHTVVGMFTRLGYILAILLGGYALVLSVPAFTQSFLKGITMLFAGTLACGATYLVTRLLHELALIGVDIADSTLEANSRKTLADETETENNPKTP
jgi:hypothetical protein